MTNLPSFTPVDARGQCAKRVLLSGNGGTHYAFNVIRKEQIRDRVSDFSTRVLNPLLRGNDVTIVPILNGAMGFAWECMKDIYEASTVQVMSVQARSYGTGKESDEVVVADSMILPEKVDGRIVVIFDDIFDTGKTVTEVKRMLEMHHPAKIITVFLVRKMHPTPPLFVPDYWLFECHPESWLFGFGMDLSEKYRHLSFICDDNEELYDRSGRPRY